MTSCTIDRLSMASLSDSALTGGLSELWSRPAIDWHWGTRALLAIALLILLLDIATVFGAPQNRDEHFIARYAFTGFENRTQINYVVSVIISFAFAGGLFGLARAAIQLDRLRPIIRRTDSEFAALRNRLLPRRRTLTLTALMGG